MKSVDLCLPTYKALAIKLDNSLKMTSSQFLDVKQQLQRYDKLGKEYVNFMIDHLKISHMLEKVKHFK